MSNDMDYVTTVQLRYLEELMAKPNVVGVAVGMAKKDDIYTNELSIVVMVEKKIPNDRLAPEDRIPEQLDGVRVDVQETGAFTIF